MKIINNMSQIQALKLKQQKPEPKGEQKPDGGGNDGAKQQQAAHLVTAATVATPGNSRQTTKKFLMPLTWKKGTTNTSTGGEHDDETMDLTDFSNSAASILYTIDDIFDLKNGLAVIESGEGGKNNKKSISQSIQGERAALGIQARKPSIFNPEDLSSSLSFIGLPLRSVDEDENAFATHLDPDSTAATTPANNFLPSQIAKKTETSQAVVEVDVAGGESTSSLVPAADNTAGSILTETNATVIVSNDESSSSSIQEAPDSNNKATVRWGTIQINEHVISMGLSAIPSCGAPITLSNAPAQATYIFRLDDYENVRVDPPRKGHEMILTKRQRTDMLLELGHTMTEIAQCVRQSQVIRQQRAQSARQPRIEIWWRKLKYAVKKARGKKAGILVQTDNIDSSYSSKTSFQSENSSCEIDANAADVGNDIEYTRSRFNLAMAQTKSEVDLFAQRRNRGQR